MTIHELRKKIKKLPMAMPVVLNDLTQDDDEGNGVYSIEENSAGVDSLLTHDNIPVKCFVIHFTNKLSDS